MYTSTDLHPLSALQAGQDELAGKKEREEERRTQCEPKRMLQSHNHHTATDCIRRITFYVYQKLMYLYVFTTSVTTQNTDLCLAF